MTAKTMKTKHDNVGSTSASDHVKASTMAKKSEVDVALLNRAMEALLKHHEDTVNGVGTSGKKGKTMAEKKKEKEQLLGTDEPVQVQIGLARVPEHPSPRPIRVTIPHPLHKVYNEQQKQQNIHKNDTDESQLEEPEVCLIVKEGSKPWVQEIVSTFPHHMSCIKKVLGLDSLRKKYRRYEQRRELLARFDLFMADDRILPMVGKCLGKNFFEVKKQPIPIKLTRKEALPFAVQNCLKATYMYLSVGTCVTIRAGNTGMSKQTLVENVEAIVSTAAEKIPRKWANIRSISIKTPNSVSLPIYNKTPEELAEIAKLAGVADATSDATPGKRKRIEEGHVSSHDQQEETKSKKKKKKELAAKSPLVRALLKQKESETKKDCPDEALEMDEITKETPKKINKTAHTKDSVEEKADTDEKSTPSIDKGKKKNDDGAGKEDVKSVQKTPSGTKHAAKSGVKENGEETPEEKSKKINETEHAEDSVEKKKLDTDKEATPSIDKSKKKNKKKRKKKDNSAKKDDAKAMQTSTGKTKRAAEPDDKEDGGETSKEKSKEINKTELTEESVEKKKLDTDEKLTPSIDKSKEKHDDSTKKDDAQAVQPSTSKKKRAPELDANEDGGETPDEKSKKVETSVTKKRKEVKDESSEEKPSFIATKVFKGAKKGYVFRKGKEGVGYYIDVKPVPDKMALEALVRMSSKSGGGSSRKAPKSGKKRRGRRRSL